MHRNYIRISLPLLLISYSKASSITHHFASIIMTVFSFIIIIYLNEASACKKNYTLGHIELLRPYSWHVDYFRLLLFICVCFFFGSVVHSIMYRINFERCTCSALHVFVEHEWWWTNDLEDLKKIFLYVYLQNVKMLKTDLYSAIKSEDSEALDSGTKTGGIEMFWGSF